VRDEGVAKVDDRPFIRTNREELILLCTNWKEETKFESSLREYCVESAGLGESDGYQEEDDKGFKEH
jgi:hypothetical protein